MEKNTYPDEVLFCVKYLSERGYLSEEKLGELLPRAEKMAQQFKFVRVQHDFFTELAEKMRPLWPAGEKDDKYPWRSSVSELSERLENLWETRNLKDYTLDECLSVARRYVAQFENNAKYMQTLKYFISKNKRIKGAKGHLDEIPTSTFADMLENSQYSTQQEEWESLASEPVIPFEQQGVFI